ncbi:MAG: AsmA-like C-terminal region-containing protein [Bacteroidota bacterium]
MRIFKKVLISLGLLIVLLLAGLLIAPYFLKDEIKEILIEEANSQVKGSLHFSELDLSFFSSFPDASISLHDFSLVGIEEFEFDTLAQAKEISLSTGIFSALSGSSININKVALKEAKLFVHILENGKANYDISVSETTEESQTESELNISLQNYSLENTDIIYHDNSIPIKMSIRELDHEVSGDFTLSKFDLDTYSEAEALNLNYDGISYIRDAKVNAHAKLSIELEPHIKVSFLDNSFQLNELPLSLDGFIELPNEEDVAMDLSYASTKSDFSALLSMVPAIYQKDFASLQTSGKLAFDGKLKGTYNEAQLPAFNLNLDVDKAMFKYPDLPKPVDGIEINLKIDNPDGNLENTQINLSEFHADLGDNPIDAKAKIKGIENIDVDGYINAKIDLAELAEVYPIEGTELAGMFTINAEAEGNYNEAKGSFPTVHARMNMDEGYIKNEEYNTELKNLSFHAKMEDLDGQMEHSKLEVPDFHFVLGGEALDGSLFVENFDSPSYKLDANGALNLAKLMEIYPIDSMQLSGKVNIKSFSTSGSYADIEAENYTNLPTSGKVEIENLKYSDLWYVQSGLSIEKGSASFGPEKLSFSDAKGSLGKSDYEASGYFSNYLAYALLDEEELKGEMKVKSRKFDTREWMIEESTETSVEEAPLEVIPVPAAIDVFFQAEVDELIYDDIQLNSFSGTVHVADQAIAMQDIGFDMLGGKVLMSGLYNTLDIKKPTYNFYLDLKQLDIQEAFKHLSLVKSFAPVTQFVEGLANMEVGISGKLKQDMTPVLENVSGLGVMEILQGKLSKSNILSKVQEKTKLNALSAGKIDIQDIIAQFEIKDGFIEVKPFNFSVQGINLRLGGKQNITGALDYSLDIDAPSGSIGNAANSALSSLSGGALKTGDRIQVNLNIGGTFQQPIVSGGQGGTIDQLKQQAADAAVDKLEDKLGVGETGISANKDSLKQQADELAAKAKDSLNQVVENAKQQAKDSVQQVIDKTKDQAQQKAEEELKRAVGDEAAEALEKLKDKVKLPFGRKKKKDKEKKEGN